MRQYHFSRLRLDTRPYPNVAVPTRCMTSAMGCRSQLSSTTDVLRLLLCSYRRFALIFNVASVQYRWDDVAKVYTEDSTAFYHTSPHRFHEDCYHEGIEGRGCSYAVLGDSRTSGT